MPEQTTPVSAELAARLALKDRLPRTWPAFFARHGTFTDVQLAAIPLLLDGHNTVVCAPTASGKTEAVVAPLIERYCPPTRQPGLVRLLYLTPTRALVNDLSARMGHALHTLNISLGVRTYDNSTFQPDHPPDILLTTPESVDSLLASRPKLFVALHAVVIDELHIFDSSPRGDQLRVLLNRLRQIRHYASTAGDAPDATLQSVAISATLAAPAQVATRYFAPVRVVHAAGTRQIEAEHLTLSSSHGDGSESNSGHELARYFDTFRTRGWRKALVFCNSRAEVEAYATLTRQRSPFGDAIFVHYSNIEAERRREIEQQFAQAESAVCFASTTLELGIDIGSVDVVLLIGPPGTLESFVQRVGRSNRRKGVSRVCCCSRTPLERVLFDSLLLALTTDTTRSATSTTWHPSPAPFRPSVAIQQVFSLLQQSPTGAVRLNQLASILDPMLAPDDIQAILGHLQERGYLAPGRPGEWRAGPRLNDMIDAQANQQPGLSTHSNIQGSTTRTVAIRSQHTRQHVASVDAHWLKRDTLTLEGRPVNVAWCDGEALWVAPYRGTDPVQRSWHQYQSSRQMLSYQLARLMPAWVGLPPGSAPFVQAPDGWWWFHWLGDCYGRALLDLMRYHVPVAATPFVGLCVHMAGEPQIPPVWEPAQVIGYLEDTYRSWEPLLNLGAFHSLLPTDLRRRAVVEQFDVDQFLHAVSDLRPCSALDTLTEDVLHLVETA